MGRASNRKKAHRQQRRRGSGSGSSMQHAMPQVIAALQAISQRIETHERRVESARQLWRGGWEPVTVPRWPDGSLGDRFLSDMLVKEVSKAPRLAAAAVPAAQVIATDPAHWNVAIWGLVRAVTFDGMSVNDPVVRALLDALVPVVEAELALGPAFTLELASQSAGMRGDEQEFPEDDGPLMLLGVMALVDATWAVVGEDPLRDVVQVLAPVLDNAHPGLEGRTIAEALLGAFAHHYRCEMPGDRELLESIDAATGNALEDLVATTVVAPRDVLGVGLAALAALAELCRSGSVSVNASEHEPASPGHRR